MSPLYQDITYSIGNSLMSANRMAYVLPGDYSLRSAADDFVKDRGIAPGSARREMFPLAATAYPMFLQASALKLGAEDDSAVIGLSSGAGLPRLAGV